MTSTYLIALRTDRPPAHIAAFLAVALLLQSAFLYLWLFAGLPLAFRVWGWTLLPAWLAPLAVLPFLFRVQASELRNLTSPFGSIGAWLQAILYPLLVFGGIVWLYTGLGGVLDPAWRWTTLGLGAAADLPLLALWLLPLTLVQDLAWRQAVAGCAPRQRGIAVAMLSGLCWTIANGVLLAAIGMSGGAGLALASAALFFGAGAFLYRVQERGAVLPSALSAAIIAASTPLLIGLRNADASRLLFGCDVEDVQALLTASVLPPEMLLAVAGGGLLLFAFLFVNSRP